MVIDEKILEEEIIKQLSKKNGYSYIKINNQEELEQNFRTQIENFNKDALNNKKITDKQFKQLMYELERKNDVFHCAQRLRDSIDIQNADEKNYINLRLFDTKKWCSNYFQVTNQVTESIDHHNSFRYDIIILINGLPLVMMELKKPGEDYRKAFKQIKRNYKSEGLKSLFNYLQLFVISNKNTTKYFVNNKADDLSEELIFSWTKENNEIINSLDQFVDSFLNKCHLGKMIARFIVLNETEEKLIVLKPYQVHAAEKLTKLVEETNNNGYVWHATGSGKTLTSFKLSQILEENLEEKYIFFLVDRKDLDEQTIQEFNKFNADIVEDIENTKKLRETIQKGCNSLIVTTIQKLNILCQQKDAVLNKLKNMKIIFIIDECHRSQAGEMRQKITSSFPRAQFLGFTGTPILKQENANLKTTDDLFEKCRHKYLLINAIKDHNVVPWEIFYLKNNDKITSNHELIVTDILEKHYENTNKAKFNALMTVSKIEDLMSYYKLFKNKKPPFKIAAIFHELELQDLDKTDNLNFTTKQKQIKNHKNEKNLAEIINDYNQTFGTKVNSRTYASHLAKKFKKKEIDLLIVVNMFLVGFDSPRTNTLYVDRQLEKHFLIQAFSRVNRVCPSPSKDRGKIVCYQTTKKNVDEAIELFAIQQKSQLKDIIQSEQEFNVDIETKLKQRIQQLLQITPNPMATEQLDDCEQQKKFLKAFKELQNFKEFIETQKPEFDWNDFNKHLPLEQFKAFKQKYEDMRIEVQKNCIQPTKKSKYKRQLSEWQKQAELQPGIYSGQELKAKTKHLSHLFISNEIENQAIHIVDRNHPEKKILKSFKINNQNSEFKSVSVQNNNLYQNNDPKATLSFQDDDWIEINGYWSSQTPPLNEKTKDDTNFEQTSYSDDDFTSEIIDFNFLKRLKRLKDQNEMSEKEIIKYIQDLNVPEEKKQMLHKYFQNNNINATWNEFVEEQLEQEKKDFCHVFTLEPEFVTFIDELIKDYKYYGYIKHTKIRNYLDNNSSFFDAYTRGKKEEIWELNGQMIEKIINFIKNFIQKEKIMIIKG
ncbi:type I restriction endonuclease subunit R [Candidatus Phytoplasma solani]|uniref:type I restriction endonuclease subunit R n=1 Tax=Candidatus Phytoplasma solani TaxID=69896 RepID=UPI00359006F6